MATVTAAAEFQRNQLNTSSSVPTPKTSRFPSTTKVSSRTRPTSISLVALAKDHQYKSVSFAPCKKSTLQYSDAIMYLCVYYWERPISSECDARSLIHSHITIYWFTLIPYSNIAQLSRQGSESRSPF